MKKLMQRLNNWWKFRQGYNFAKYHDELHGKRGPEETMKTIKRYHLVGLGDSPYVRGMEQYLADVLEDV